MLNLDLGRSAAPAFRVLCLGAHCDDIEIGCGGTILSLLERYDNMVVCWVVFSSTDERAQEARAGANAFLKAAREKEIVVKQYRDGFLPYAGGQIKDDFEALKRLIDPDLIFTHYRDDRHQDHRLISDLTWNTFRNHLVLEYEIPKYDGDMGQPNVFVPLGTESYQKKVRYIMDSFQSQQDKAWFRNETFLSLMRLRGMECNADSCYAEAFYCHKIVL